RLLQPFTDEPLRRLIEPSQCQAGHVVQAKRRRVEFAPLSLAVTGPGNDRGQWTGYWPPAAGGARSSRIDEREIAFLFTDPHEIFSWTSVGLAWVRSRRADRSNHRIEAVIGSLGLPVD